MNKGNFKESLFYQNSVFAYLTDSTVGIAVTNPTPRTRPSRKSILIPGRIYSYDTRSIILVNQFKKKAQSHMYTYWALGKFKTNFCTTSRAKHYFIFLPISNESSFHQTLLCVWKIKIGSFSKSLFQLTKFFQHKKKKLSAWIRILTNIKGTYWLF